MENKSKDSTTAMKTIWNFFISLKLTVVLLLTLAMTSVIGTVLPQNADPDAYRQAFGNMGYRLFSFLDLFDMYHSWWFLLLLTLLTVNIVVCSINRLNASWNFIFTREPKFNLENYRGMKNRIEFNVLQNSEIMLPAVKSYLSKHFGYSIQQDGQNGPVFFAEKWRWSRLSVYVVHLSIVLLLIGAIIGSIFGFDGYVNIPEGESTRTIYLRGSSAPMELDFSIRCNDFDVSFYDNGMPKEFRSSLSILEGSEVVLARDIVVNDPLRFRGINFFQSSYGEMPPSEQSLSSGATITLSVTSKETSKIYSVETGIGKTVQMPENLGTLNLNQFLSSYDFQGNDLGSTLVGTLKQNDGAIVEIILPVNFPAFDRMIQRLNPDRTDALSIALQDIENAEALMQAKRYYTGLQVTKDPGVDVVYAGFILLLAGCAFAFFMSHQQVCIEVSPKKSKTWIAVSGKASKGKYGMRRKVEEISNTLQSLAKTTAKKG